MKRILLIDDSMIQLRILQGLLRNKYDMPIMSGKETYRKLQEQDETKDIPVVFLTGVDGRKEVEEVLVYRPQGYLLKPVQQNRLLETVEKLLE